MNVVVEDPTPVVHTRRGRLVALLVVWTAATARAMSGLPGVLALACTVTGVWGLAGPWWAALSAAPFFVAMDWRTR